VRGLLAAGASLQREGWALGKLHGDGYIQIEMQFLPDVTVPCEVCHGARYNREALEILFRGKSIAEVLNMTVSESGARTLA
jgi:excinuclease ABC subunit A